MKHSTEQFRFLLIEDNPGDFLLISDFLDEMMASPEVLHAKNFAQAKEILSGGNQHFDVILLDLSLPDKKGIDLVNEITPLAGSSPVLVLTGYENLDFSIKSLSLGITDYLLKDEINAYTLYKSVLFSIERKKFIVSLEQSEKRYSELFHSSPIPTWVFETENLKIQDVNKAAINHYGYSEKEFLQMSIADLNHRSLETEKQQLLPDQSKSVSGKKEFIRHKKKSGETIYVKVEKSYVQSGDKTYCIFLANDITELLQTQHSLRTAYKNIVEIEEKEKERFAAEIHDGLAQNLVAVQMIYSNLKEQYNDLSEHPQAAVLENTIATTIKECREIVNDVRPKELIDIGFDFMLNRLIQKTAQATNMNIKLQSEISLDEFYKYNELFHLYRILQENFNNCIKYAQASEVDIRIGSNKKNIWLSFSDNGIGVPDKILNKPSSFMSLKRRVQVLNGKMKVKNTSGGGVTFLYSIPY